MAGMMEDMLVRELLRRGEAISLSAATPAGFSILSGDRLALDNLASKIEQSQEDVAYLAIVDPRRQILAHGTTGTVGSEFRAETGDLLHRDGERTVHAVRREEGLSFESHTPVEFSGKHIGDIYLGIDGEPLRVARSNGAAKSGG